MNELGLVGFREPVARLFNQGMLHHRRREDVQVEGQRRRAAEYAERYGADTVRMYALFMGPADEDMEWQDAGIEGIWRFLNRLWRVAHEQAERPATATPVDTPLLRKAHRTIAKVTDDIDRRFLFHTPISAVMELVNEIQATPDDPAARFAAETAVSLIQPYAPHIAEELWAGFGHERLWRAPVAGGRPGAARGGRGRGRRAGERQAARSPARPGRHVRGRARSRWRSSRSACART